jgi:hypothetical protein
MDAGKELFHCLAAHLPIQHGPACRKNVLRGQPM